MDIIIASVVSFLLGATSVGYVAHRRIEDIQWKHLVKEGNTSHELWKAKEVLRAFIEEDEINSI